MFFTASSHAMERASSREGNNVERTITGARIRTDSTITGARARPGSKKKPQEYYLYVSEDSFYWGQNNLI